MAVGAGDGVVVHQRELVVGMKVGEAGGVAGQAQLGGRTPEQRAACEPDAMRLCLNAIPDVSRVALCLAQNKKQLSSACAVVFNRPRGASATRERQENIQKTNF